ncbi:MAG TPA: very short patch repair endonuclease [Candidatus Babeliales bacterium]|nr:very short patch repair endonuclease [Candidatus Babeliales bacterium]
MASKKRKFKNPVSQRSYIMSRVKSRGNKSTELVLIRILRKYKITGWRRHISLKGRPDFCFVKEKLAVFVDGCFWHGCIKCYRAPKMNADYWQQKIKYNLRRDISNARFLRHLGWSVLRFREHILKDSSKHQQIAIKILNKLSESRK